MWSKIVLLTLVAVAVTAEEITIEDYQGPEEQEIVDRTIDFLNKATGDNFEVIGEVQTVKFLYSYNQKGKRYEVTFDSLPKGMLGRTPTCVFVNADQNEHDKIEVKRIRFGGCSGPFVAPNLRSVTARPLFRRVYDLPSPIDNVY